MPKGTEMDWLSLACGCGVHGLPRRRILCHSKCPRTPQDRACGPGKDAEDEEGYGNKGVIVNKDSLGDEKSQSPQRQGREKTRNRSHPRNGSSAIDDMRMAAHDP